MLNFFPDSILLLLLSLEILPLYLKKSNYKTLICRNFHILNELSSQGLHTSIHTPLSIYAAYAYNSVLTLCYTERIPDCVEVSKFSEFLSLLPLRYYTIK